MKLSLVNHRVLYFKHRVRSTSTEFVEFDTRGTLIERRYFLTFVGDLIILRLMINRFSIAITPGTVNR